MIANISDVIGILGANGTIKYKSENLSKFFGWRPEELVGKDSLFNVHPDDLERVKLKYEEVINTPGKIVEVEFRYLCKDSNYKYVSLIAKNMINDPLINGVLINYEDISDKIKQEEERVLIDAHLRNQQKLEAIGTLASGVAHEINNPINGILNYGQIILDSEPGDKVIKEYANEIIIETNRVAEIVRNLLDFSRQSKQEHSYASIEDIISKTLLLINTVINKDQIELNVDIEKNIPKIKCRSQQIQQVLLNLITNARDALNSKYPQYDENKKIIIKCSQHNEDGENWVRICVEDLGIGISKDSIDKIFDPFFSMKGREKGTGLGLSISYGIVNEHHGVINVESEEGKFTKFIISLPCDNGWEHS